MKRLLFTCIFQIVAVSILFSQKQDTTQTTTPSSAEHDTASTINETIADSSYLQLPIDLRKKPFLKQPTMPRLHLSDKNKKFEINVTNDPFRPPNEKTNWDASNMPTNRTDYEITNEYVRPFIPVTPLEVLPEKAQKPLLYNEYIIPTRQELDILEVLWTRENVMDTTIYTCLDTTLNITMEDLNKLLKEMTQKGLAHRDLVSPRNEFNAFGILIEMSMQNRRNRVFEYRSNVDREVMRRFINANAYLFKEDSSIVNHSQLKEARGDKTLLEDLNAKIYQPTK